MFSFTYDREMNRIRHQCKDYNYFKNSLTNVILLQETKAFRGVGKLLNVKRQPRADPNLLSVTE